MIIRIIKKIIRHLQILNIQYFVACCITSLLVIGFLSCDDRKEIYYHFQELESSKWSKNDTLYFNIDSSEVVINTPLDIQLYTINDSDYPYQNVWLYVQDNFKGRGFEKFDLQYNLADEMGRWYGSGFGSLYQLSLDYKKGITFTEKRNYQLKIIHGMRNEPLIGLEKIGVSISKSE